MCAINVDCEAAQLRVPGGSSSFMCKCVCMLFYVLVCVWRVFMFIVSSHFIDCIFCEVLSLFVCTGISTRSWSFEVSFIRQ